MKSFYAKILIVLVLVFCAGSLMAQVRVDLALDVPFYFGIQFSGEESVGVLSEFTLLFPEVSAHYLLDLGPLKVGAGLRMYSFILESIGWPNLIAELDIDPITFTAQVGGGALVLFGLYNDVVTSPIVLGDVSAAVKFGENFRAGVGVFTIGETDDNLVLSETGAVPFAAYAFGKFSFSFDEDKDKDK